jgi:hypothetical protein
LTNCKYEICKSSDAPRDAFTDSQGQHSAKLSLASSVLAAGSTMS